MKRKVNVNRYLFHASHPCSREGILEKGLLVSGRENSMIPRGVYAHNLLTEPNFKWYPFVLIGEYDYQNIKGIDPVRMYDYWRIDTFKLKNNWFIDFAARFDFMNSIGFDPYSMYVYTDENINTNALTLFRFQNNQSWDFEGNEGVYHFRGISEFRPYTEI